MTTTPPVLKPGQEALDPMGDCWIDLTQSSISQIIRTPERVTPIPFATAEEYLRLLREAQESNQSSRVVSLSSSRRDSPHGSPKSPPNSPNTELATEDELKGVYINYSNRGGALNRATGDEWVWDFSSLPNQVPPTDWNFTHPTKARSEKGYSIRSAHIGKYSVFSKDVLTISLVTFSLAVVIGIGLGYWLGRRGQKCICIA